MFKLYLVTIFLLFGISKTVFGQTNFRLVGGTSNSNGRVEVLYNGTWGTVCDDGWSSANTLVVCRSLGFVSGYKIQPYPGTGQMWLDDVKCVGTESSLTECDHAPWGSNNCAHIEDISLHCHMGISTSTAKSIPEVPLMLRLAGGNRRSYGRVEIFYKGQWGTVCDDLWDNNDARVVCRMLGYDDGIAFSGGRYGQGSGPIWIDNAECTGRETTISNCPRNSWGENNCRHIEDAGVECITRRQTQNSSFITSTTVSITSKKATTTPFSIRLIGGNGRNSGRVEILYQGRWGTVCDDQWDDRDAHVICHMMGYSGGTSQGNARYGPGTGKIWLDEVNCLGNETSIDQCQKNNWGQHNCGHAEDAGVNCTVTTTTQQQFTSTQAVTTQQQLTNTQDFTFSSATQAVVTTTTPTTTTTTTTAPTTTTTTLAATTTTNIPTVSTPISVRLVGGNGRNNGRVEILYQGQWGTVCDDRWDDKEAKVICRMLGYSGGTAQGNARYGPGTGNIWLDEVNCSGNETLIDQCMNIRWGKHNCVHSEDAGVDCTVSFTQVFPSTRGFITFPTTRPTMTNTDKISSTQKTIVHTTQQMDTTRVSRTSTDINSPVLVRLVGSNSSSHGRVEIFYQNQWGTVCDDQWDNNDARVICHMLGFSDGISTAGGSYGPGNGSIWLDEVQCSGMEQSITECNKNQWGSNDCKHSEDAGVKCGKKSTPTTSQPLSVRLVGGNSPSSGRVEINYNNEWGTVCQDKWDDNDARVLCNMLGYSHGLAFNAAKYGMGSGNIWLDEVNCTGTENSIADCDRNSWGVHDCHHGEDAGVDCSTNAIPVGVRLVGGETPSSGRVELNLYGEWGTVCDDGWDNRDARVICRMLGYVDGIGLSFSWYGAGTGKIFLDDVNCVGNETNIIECKKNSWESSNCNHGEDASVQCFLHKAITTTPSLTPDVSVRLAGSDSSNNGRVEIQYNGQWGTICDDSWDDRDARVICRMLGFIDGSANVSFGAGSGPIWLDQVQCDGSELSVIQCMRNRWGIHDCNHNEDAGVDCSTTIIGTNSSLKGFSNSTQSSRTAAVIQQVRLVDGNNLTAGRLEVMINNVWGTVCDDNWDKRDATVACRMMGFSSGIGYRNAIYGSGMNQIWLDEVNCTGRELSLNECEFPTAGLHDCSHLEDAGVQCFTSENNIMLSGNTANIRLADGQNTKEGRVEIYHNGEWGSICNNNWNKNNTNVVCKMLGFRKGDILNQNNPGTERIWLSNVDCNGNELSLEQCNKNDWGVHNCQHTQDVSIICQ